MNFYSNLHIGVMRREEDNRLVYAVFGFLKGERLRLSPWSRNYDSIETMLNQMEQE